MQLRIIAGNLRGRWFDAPRGKRTHPMGEKVRGALFNVLGDISGMSVLDCYAGSGALGFEAISRGASNVLFIENDKTAHATINHTIDVLGVKRQAQAIRANVTGWSASNIAKQFNIVLCDPPYDAILASTIEKIARHVAVGGVLVLSWPAHVDIPEILGMQAIKNKTYAAATLVFYQKSG